MTMRRAVVVNAGPELMGKTALVMDHPNPDRLQAQFDDLDLTYTLPSGEILHLGIGWHEFHRDAFDVDDDQLE